MTEILVGIDDAPGSQDALAFAARVAATAGASLRLASAFPYSDVPSRASNEAYREFLQGDARALLDRAAQSAEGVTTSTEAIADTSPAHALHALAERTDAALVVVGSTHHGPVGQVVPGSTGERLLHGASCPVAVVPRGWADAAIETIGVGYDGSGESEAALSAACQIARRFGAALRVIGVLDPSRLGAPALTTVPGWETVQSDYEAGRREALDRAVAGLPSNVNGEAVFVMGSAGRELSAESEQVDLMVVGSRGYGPRTAVLLGGVTHTLIRKAACPVIVLPRGAHGLEPLFTSAEAATA
jgi:nucleotide-binding universal stress UspA family protein